MLIKGALHLVAHDVRCLTSFLDIHAKLNNIQEELEHILILRVSSLHSKREKRLSVLYGQAGS